MSVLLTIASNLIVLVATPVQSARTYRVVALEEVQLESHLRVNYADVVYLTATGSWDGTACLSNYAWFNAKENSQFLAMALTARATGASVKIWVDDTLAKLDGYCQILNMSM